MARPVRIEYPGAVYHVICRGNNRQAVFRDNQDRRRYLEKLSFYCEEKGVELLCYCLLTNHTHLLLEIPKGNLSKMMQPFQTSYTVYFNKRHGRSGHVFGGMGSGIKRGHPLEDCCQEAHPSLGFFLLSLSYPPEL